MLKAVLKIGGSLARGDALPALCRSLAASGREHAVLVVPGGGAFADVVRDCHGSFPLSESAAHWMAILGMDQYGLLLADLIPDARIVTDPESARIVARERRIPVLLPSAWLRRDDPLPHSFDVTSDSIAAWIALEANVPRCVLVKDTDGLCRTDPRLDPAARPQPTMSLAELAACRGVDRHLPRLLAGSDLEVWAVCGERPERLARLLATGHTRGTRVLPQAGETDGPPPQSLQAGLWPGREPWDNGHRFPQEQGSSVYTSGEREQ